MFRKYSLRNNAVGKIVSATPTNHMDGTVLAYVITEIMEMIIIKEKSPNRHITLFLCSGRDSLKIKKKK